MVFIFCVGLCCEWWGGATITLTGVTFNSLIVTAPGATFSIALMTLLQPRHVAHITAVIAACITIVIATCITTVIAAVCITTVIIAHITVVITTTCIAARIVVACITTCCSSILIK
ncbi:hypothetical protein LXA43DRAFT_1064837 [Ganoderma leucocontextum]|nr:hypothetical protein LXA43DRAFT_1064837 [Ganoderma leucocontextum]